MTTWRILNLITWLSVSGYMRPGAWAAALGRDVRRGDPMRLGCFATAIVMMGFNLRWLVMPDSILVWQMLHALSIADAIFIVTLARAYGRGGYVR